MTQQKTLTAALVGCGRAATWAHIPALKAIPEVNLVSVCDVDLARAKQVAANFGIPSAYGSAPEMLEKESVDVVHVLTNPESHLELTLLAMDAGSNVLIEKPFVYTVDEADRAIAKGKETGTRFSVIHNDIFTPAVIELKARITAGEIGTITSVHFFAARRNQRAISGQWYYTTYGGRMGETLPHGLCLLVEMVDGLEVRHVDARRLGHCIPPDGVKDCGIDELHVQLVSEADNAVGTIFYGFNSDLPDSLLVCGTQGHLLAHLKKGSVTQLRQLPRINIAIANAIANVTDKIFRKFKLRSAAGQPSSHYRQIRAYVLHLRDGTDYSVTEAKAREVTVLWERIVKAYSD